MPNSDISKNAVALPEHAQVLLDRLKRLRVCTAPQAHLLTPSLARQSLRSAYGRLATLVNQQWLLMDAVVPSKGATTPYFYRPSSRALTAMGLPRNGALVRRPAQHVLEYLLLRAEIYARASASGFYIGSPIFLPKEKHAAALARFHDFLKGRALERLKAGQAKRLAPAQLVELRTAVDQLPHFLPKTLDFEFLYSIDPNTSRTNSVVLLLVDDVRREVAKQVKALPLVAKADCSILVRDCDSVFSGETNSLVFTGTRLFELRRAVTRRFGPEMLATESILPNVWARVTRPTGEASASSSRKQKEASK